MTDFVTSVAGSSPKTGPGPGPDYLGQRSGLPWTGWTGTEPLLYQVFFS